MHSIIINEIDGKWRTTIFPPVPIFEPEIPGIEEFTTPEGALGYAAGIAFRLGLHLIDRTGRWSDDDLARAIQLHAPKTLK